MTEEVNPLVQPLRPLYVGTTRTPIRTAVANQQNQIQEERMKWVDLHLPFGDEEDRPVPGYEPHVTGTFQGLGLLRPGIQFEYHYPKTGEKGRYFVGTMNDDGGICNCCSPLYKTAIVTRYRVLVDEDTLNAD